MSEQASDSILLYFKICVHPQIYKFQLNYSINSLWIVVHHGLACEGLDPSVVGMLYIYARYKTSCWLWAHTRCYHIRLRNGSQWSLHTWTYITFTSWEGKHKGGVAWEVFDPFDPLCLFLFSRVLWFCCNRFWTQHKAQLLVELQQWATFLTAVQQNGEARNIIKQCPVLHQLFMY